MALDEPKADDELSENDGIRFTVAKKDSNFIFASGGVHIDHYRYPWGEGFVVRNTGATSCC